MSALARRVKVYRCKKCGATFKVEEQSTYVTCPNCGSDEVEFIGEEEG